MKTLGRCSSSLLLVEENETIMAPLRDWLTLSFPDVQLVTTTDHQRAAALTRSESPDVLLIDIDISSQGREGVRIVRRLSAARPSTTIFALITTESHSCRQALLEAGADGCACMWKLRDELLPYLREHLSEGQSDLESAE